VFVSLWLLTYAAGSSAAAGSDVADAAMKRDAETVRTLLQKNVDVNLGQPDGTTALHWAARWDDVATARDLIGAGEIHCPQMREGASPRFLATMIGNASMIELLLKAGADPNQPVLSHGETPLMMAARTGKPEAIKMLLDHGALVNAAENLRG